MLKKSPLLAVVLIAATALTSCSGEDAPASRESKKNARLAIEDRPESEYGNKVAVSEVYVDGQLVTLIGGTNPDDWSAQMTAAESVELLNKAQANYQASPSQPTDVRITVDGTSTEFLLNDPATDLAGPWEKFAKESAKFKELPETVHHFAGPESSLDNDTSARTNGVDLDTCVQNIQAMIDAAGSLDPAIDDDYSANIGAHACGEHNTLINLHISRAHAEKATKLMRTFKEVNGPELVAEMLFDGPSGELTLVPRDGVVAEGEAFDKLHQL